jgi:SAM-dependent methyltransferase
VSQLLPSRDPARLAERTVGDFGEQWTRYRDNRGWYGSLDHFRDKFGSVLTPSDVAGRRVADVGSGTGRVVQMLLEAGAAHVTAFEPSDAFAVLLENTRAFGAQVSCERRRGDELPAGADFDLIVSVGVLHHIPDPHPVVAAALGALRPGGRFAVWLYGKEGNRLYLALVGPLRQVTTRLPHRALSLLAWLLTCALTAYAAACRLLPLPLRAYMRRVIANLPFDKRELVVYDQLNPAYAKYYSREEAYGLLADGGFRDVRLDHRHGYSWAVVGARPNDTSPAGTS